MAIALLVARLLLGVLLVIAGIAKAVSVGGTASTLSQFGFPRRTVRPLALALPPVEMVTALALVGSRTAAVGVVAATVLLASFLAVTGQAVRRGRAVSCHCFGSLSNAPVGKATVVRNAVLLVVAAATATLTLRSGSVPGIAYSDLSGTQWAVGGLAVAVVLLSCAFWRTVIALLEQQGRLLLRIDELSGVAPAGTQPIPQPVVAGLPVGSRAPDFALRDLNGETRDLAALTGLALPVLLVFADRQCTPCTELMPHVAHWQREHAGRLTTVVIAADSAEDMRAYAREQGLTTVLLDATRSVSTALRSPGTPSAVLIDTDGRVAAELAAGLPAVQALARSVLSSGAASPGPMAPVAREVPAFSLLDLSGTPTSQSWFAQHESTVVLFWNPSCGFCQRMEPRLQQWVRRTGGDGPALLIISTGDAERHAGLRAHVPVLLDDGRVSGAFGATGTPMAVRVNGYGVISSEVAAGEQAVFDLLEPLDGADRPIVSAFSGGMS